VNRGRGRDRSVRLVRLRDVCRRMRLVEYNDVDNISFSLLCYMAHIISSTDGELKS